MNNFLRKYRTRYTTYNKLLEIESEDRVYLEKEIRNMNSFEGLFHPGISFIGSFIHFFLFFSLSQQRRSLEKSSETAFDLSALDPPRLLPASPPPPPHAVRAQYCIHSTREVLPSLTPSPSRFLNYHGDDDTLVAIVAP